MEEVRRVSSLVRPSPRFDCLPEEVLTTIFQYLNSIDLISISRTTKHFTPVADSNLLWRNLTLRDFRLWDSRHDIISRKADLNFHGWKQLYAIRHHENIDTRRKLTAMVDDPIGRLRRSDSILDYGYDVKDVLLQAYTDAPEECVLAQRYWSAAMLACLNRSLALEAWTRVRYRSDVQDSTELALAALDMFVLGSEATGDIEDSFRRMNEMADAVRLEHPQIDRQSPRTKAALIAEVLRRKGWVGIQEGRDYYSIEHQFLGLALRSPHRSSLPLISCVIYCYVCRQFGLRAQPCSFPMHVHAVVQPSLPAEGEEPIDLDGNTLPPQLQAQATTNYSDLDEDAEAPHEMTHLYIDPFNTNEPVRLSVLQQQLNFIDPSASRGRKATYMLPASARSLIVRSAHNLIRSIRSPATTPGIDISIYDAAYAALFVLVLFPNSPEALSASLDDLRSHFAHHFPEDIRNYETYVLPLTTGVGIFGGSRGMQDPLVRHIRAQDAMAPSPKSRNSMTNMANDEIGPEEQQKVLHKVGTVFRHRRQGYVAVIYGWDPRCEMEESWIRGNGVDRLPQGRAQPFYNA